MLSRNEYVDILERLIDIHLNDYFTKVVRSNEDIYNDLLSAIMQADWKHEIDSRGQEDNHGFRRNMFIWTLGKIKREFSKPKNHYYQCSNFDNWPDYSLGVSDGNLFFEEFQSDILSSKKLTKKEKMCLIGIFVDMKPVKELGFKDNKTIRKHINTGIDKLKGGYGIFKLERISKYC